MIHTLGISKEKLKIKLWIKALNNSLNALALMCAFFH